MPLSIVILAAGQGKRMKSDLPKVLQPLAGRPLLAHVVDDREGAATPTRSTSSTATAASGSNRRSPNEPVNWVLQAEQLGTGHARRAGDAGDSRRSPGARSCSATCRCVRTRRCEQLVAQAGTARARRCSRWCSTIPTRLRPHRARQRRQRRAHRRGEGREHQGARDPRDQHRPDDRAGAASCAAGSPRSRTTTRRASTI